MKTNNITNNKIHKRVSAGFSEEEFEKLLKCSNYHGLTAAPLVRMATIEFMRKHFEKMGTHK